MGEDTDQEDTTLGAPQGGLAEETRLKGRRGEERCRWWGSKPSNRHSGNTALGAEQLSCHVNFIKTF